MIRRDFPGRGKVAVLRTSPETVTDDIGRLMDLGRVPGCPTEGP